MATAFGVGAEGKAADGSIPCCGTTPGGNPSGCSTYLVVIKNTLGDPQAGIALTLSGHSRGSGNTTIPATVSGSTDSDGTFTYALSQAEIAASLIFLRITAVVPDPCTDPTRVAIGGFGNAQGTTGYPAGTCVGRMTVKRIETIINTVDGETGAPLGAALGGNPVNGGSADSRMVTTYSNDGNDNITTTTRDCLNGQTVPGCVDYTAEGITNEGTRHVAKYVELRPANGPADGTSIQIGFWGTNGLGGTACLSGYWGGSTFSTAYQPTTTSDPAGYWDIINEGTLVLFSKARWVYNPQRTFGPFNDRNMVIAKKLCLSGQGLSATAVGDALATGLVTLNWDSTSWDGDPATGHCGQGMVWRASLSGGGTNRSDPTCGGLPEDAGPYGAVCCSVSISNDYSGGSNFPSVSVQVIGSHDGTCDSGSRLKSTWFGGVPIGTCGAGNRYLMPFVSKAEYRINQANGSRYVYCERDPRNYDGAFIIGSTPGGGSAPLPVPLNLTFGGQDSPLSEEGQWGCRYVPGAPTPYLHVTECVDGGGGSNPYTPGPGGTVDNPTTPDQGGVVMMAPPGVRARSDRPLEVDTLASLNPSYAAELGKQADAPEVHRLAAQVHACPHRRVPACGCPALPSACALGKGGPAGVTFGDCLACRRSDGVRMLGHMNSHTGYGQHVIDMGKALEALGVPVLFEPIDTCTEFLPLDDFAARRIL